MSGWEIKTPDGRTIDHVMNDMIAAAQVTDADLLYAGERFKAMMLERTDKGLDVDGRQFAPYNDTRPYYYYPAKNGLGVRPTIQFSRNKAYGLGMSHQTVLKSVRKELEKRDRYYRRLGLKGPSVKFGMGTLGVGEGEASKTTFSGIKFSSYAAFKAALGRGTVDLFGPSAPHMLQSIIVSAKNMVLVVGIYDEEMAAKARGHNNGVPGRLPQRRFFDVSPEEIVAMEKAVAERLTARVRKKT